MPHSNDLGQPPQRREESGNGLRHTCAQLLGLGWQQHKDCKQQQRYCLEPLGRGPAAALPESRAAAVDSQDRPLERLSTPAPRVPCSRSTCRKSDGQKDFSIG